MATIAEMARLGAAVNTKQLAHLQRLVSWWNLLADVSFADLLLFAPSHGDEFVVVAQVRPSTSQTLYNDDQVGKFIGEVSRPLVARSFRLTEIVEGEVTLGGSANQRARVRCIPVMFEGDVVGIMTRETPPDFGRVRRLGELEKIYLEIFGRFADMIAAGQFPFRSEEVDPEDMPRVGDGALVVDDAARILYSSPNALSTLHRVRVQGNVVGRRLSNLGLGQSVVRDAIREIQPFAEEVERGDVTVQVVALPFAGHRRAIGAIVLLRDVSELRRQDRLLMSKDATIREIHHRVKNNLQTISSLLRLQGRRVSSPEAKQAIDDSVRRIRAISLVHETLAQEPGDDVSLAQVMRELALTVQEGLASPDRPIRFNVVGDAGLVPAEVVTPLAVVLNELLQNVVDHAFPPDTPVVDGVVGTVDIEVAGSMLLGIRLEVRDDGVGLPVDFDISRPPGLGTTIVHALVTSDLNGEIDLKNRSGCSGATAVVTVPPQQIDE